MKEFNVTGTCFPEDHYMVDTSNKLQEIKKLVDTGKYFTINRGRQYGKTTTLELLRKTLKNEYTVVKMSFEGVGETLFGGEEAFCQTFLEFMSEGLLLEGVSEEYSKRWLDKTITTFHLLSMHITAMCKGRKIVILADEVDKNSNYRVYQHFLGMLRDKYLVRKDKATFHAVILAGVYDIRNIKLKMISEGTHIPVEGECLYTSPWNIAVNFKVNMSFNPSEISTMLTAYENDHHTGMDIMSLSQEIYNFTSGYPYLVSDICKIIEEELDKNWTIDGIQEAVKLLLKENNTLFDDIGKNLENNQELYDLIYNVLINGRQQNFDILHPVIELGAMYGILCENKGKVSVSNRIFEIRITEYFIAKDQSKETDKAVTGVLKYDVVKDGKFNMELCLRKFAMHYGEIFSEKDAAYLERQGRLMFLTYLRPLINGEGFYHIETELSDERKMDLVVDFNKEQFIVELKVWRGKQYHQEGLDQLADYLESKNATTGYLVTFDFKKQSKQCGEVDWITHQGKNILDVMV